MIRALLDNVNSTEHESASAARRIRRDIQPRTPPPYENDNFDDVDKPDRQSPTASDHEPIASDHEPIADNRDEAQDSQKQLPTKATRFFTNKHFRKWKLDADERLSHRYDESLPEPNPFQSSCEQRRGTFVPDWVFELTEDDSERMLLGHLIYWTGYSLKGQPRMKRTYRFSYPIDQQVYHILTAKFIGKRLRKSKDQIYRIVRRLKKKAFVIACRHKRGSEFAFRIRLNWEEILLFLDARYGASNLGKAGS